MYNDLSLTTCLIKIYADTDEVMATATAFFYKYQGNCFLITNAHNVTGYNYETKEKLSKSAAIPKKIRICARQISEDGLELINCEYRVDLYYDEFDTKPNWFFHPHLGYSVDVVAFHIDETYFTKNNILCSPINENSNLHTATNISLEVSDDVYVLGYPEKIVDDNIFPIWKRGSIASEPSWDYKNLPRYLIDTLTRRGMSGSPVIMKRIGAHPTLSLIGTVAKFAGVYSGRFTGASEFDGHLGIVWTEQAILEILEARTYGDTEFHHGYPSD